MNFECLMRKRDLGIENHNDYIIWAQKLQENNCTLESVNVLAHQEIGFNDDFVKRPHWPINIYNNFKKVVKELDLEIPSIQLDDSPQARTVRSVYKKSKDVVWIYTIDIRARADISPTNDTAFLLDAMAVNCGVEPLGNLWYQLPERIGRQGLKEAFSRSCVSPNHVYIGDAEAQKVADEFSSHFSGSVQYYSSSSTGLLSDRRGGHCLQTWATMDFGIILLDEKNIGMVVVIGED